MAFALILLLAAVVSFGTFVFWIFKGIGFVSRQAPTAKQLGNWIIAEVGLLVFTVLALLVSVITGGFAVLSWIVSFF